MQSMHFPLCTVTVWQPNWKVILCYSEDEQVNKLISFFDDEKSSSPFVWFLKMCWPFCRVQLQKQPLCSLSLTPCLWFLWPEFDITLTALCGSWFQPVLTLPTYPQAHTHTHTHTRIHTHTHTEPLLSCVILTMPPPPTLQPFLWTPLV